MNFRSVTNILGRILLIEGALLLSPLVTAGLYHESILPFLWTAAITAVTGGFLLLFSRGRTAMHTREGFVSVALSWILMSLFGTLPFLFSGTIPHFIDALFEITSGFTTTGASILTDIESLPRGILFWRSFSHWIGGMGVLVFMMAILPTDDEHSMHLLRAEVPGPVKGKLVPRMRTTARILYLIYIGLTAAETLLLLVGGMPLYDALLTAFGTTATGGFSVRNASIGAYNSLYIEIVITVFMLLSGINFNLFYIVLMKRSIRGFKSEELFWYLIIIVFSAVTIALNLLPMYETFGNGLRYSLFQVVSIITSTGYATAGISDWPGYSRTLLLLLMLVGACAGSTGGGTKIARLVIVIKAAYAEIRHQLFPRSVTRVTLDGERLDDRTVRNTMAYYMLYALIVLASCLLLSLDNHDLDTALSCVISCLSNIGPGYGAASASFAVWSAPAKLLLCVCMLLGRLEIFPMLMLFAPGVWVAQKK